MKGYLVLGFVIAGLLLLLFALNERADKQLSQSQASSDLTTNQSTEARAACESLVSQLKKPIGPFEITSTDDAIYRSDDDSWLTYVHVRTTGGKLLYRFPCRLKHRDNAWHPVDTPYPIRE